LARAATDEAEAVARRASVQACEEADKQAGSALSQVQTVEAALSAEREASLSLHRSLGAARSELEIAKQKVSELTTNLDHMRDAFAIERTTLRSELSEAERCFAAADTLRQQAESARIEEVAREKATIQKLTEALAQVRSELDAARQDVASRAADMEAARERADAAVRTQADLAQSVNEARTRIDAVSGECDRLKAELESAHQRLAASSAAAQTVETERAALEQKWHDAEARVQAVTRERDSLLGEQKDTKTQLEAARQSATTAAAALQAVDGQRIAVEQNLREVEARAQTAARERDALVVERDAAKVQHDALVAERDAAQARRDAVVAERDAAQTQLEAAQQGSTTANAALQSLDAHRATLEQNWHQAESRIESLTRELDAANAERDEALAERAAALATVESLRKAVDDAENKQRARFTELRQRTERQIKDLETQLLGNTAVDSVNSTLDEDGPEIEVSLDDDVDGVDEAFEIDAPMAARPNVAPMSRAAQAPAAPAGQPVRAASRHGFRDPLEVKLDGASAMLVDVSTAGAQVLANSALKPNKAVKLLLPSSEAIILCKARIVWSRFEPPTPGKPVRYRAGMAFTQADVAALQLFITRHTGVKMAPTAPSEERKTGRLISVPFPTATRTEESPRRSREPIASIDFNFPASRD
jgi:chromosome segregation ATPase